MAGFVPGVVVAKRSGVRPPGVGFRILPLLGARRRRTRADLGLFGGEVKAFYERLGRSESLLLATVSLNDRGRL